MSDPAAGNVKNYAMNRRVFIQAAALAGAAGTIAAQGRPEVAPPRSRVGISDAAYRRAWRRAEKFVAAMTLAEKIAQVNNPGAQGPCNGTNGVPAIARLGLPPYNYASDEGLHGLVDPPLATSFPLPLAMACSWNPELALRVYTAVSDEARAYHKKEKWGLSYYSPQTLNLHRDPRWGRCEEAPGEDPCLAGTWAVQVVRGMQGDDPNYLKTTACAKHFICNNTDDDRQRVSASVDPRSFWEYYTRAYQACVLEGDVFTFMGAYNAINGIPCCGDRFLLTDLLRKRWGFRGYVTSDNPAVFDIYDPHHYVATRPQAAALGIQAGCDLIRYTGRRADLTDSLSKAVALELVSVSDLDQAITRLLTVRILLGELDAPEDVPYNRINFDVVDSPAHRALALDAARQSIVLLKNQQQFLPLDRSKLLNVAVIGPTAGFHLGGYSGHPSVRISPYQGIADALGAKGHPTLVYHPGCSVAGPKDEKLFAQAVAAAKTADVVILVCGVDQQVDREAHDRKDTKLPGVQHELIKACYQANAKTVLVLNSNNTVAVNWEQENLPAIVAAIFGGQAQGTAIADVLFGNYNPGGKTCCTWYQSVDQLPPFHNYDIMKGRTYMYFEGDALYPFGYGLSYTTFHYSDLRISSSELSSGKSIKVSCKITNTGSRAGAEVVQFYIAAPKSPVKRPVKQLAGFMRVELKPGETRGITFELPYHAQALWYWHESDRKFVLQPGKLKLLIGSSSADIHLHGEVALQPCNVSSLGGPETLRTTACSVS